MVMVKAMVELELLCRWRWWLGMDLFWHNGGNPLIQYGVCFGNGTIHAYQKPATLTTNYPNHIVLKVEGQQGKINSIGLF